MPEVKKSTWGSLKGGWVPLDLRDEVVDYAISFSKLAELPMKQVLRGIGLQRQKFYDWRKRYGKVNKHNSEIPRDHWLEDWEQQAILDFHEKHPMNGYRRLSFMMIDEGVACASPATVHRVLSAAGRLDRWHKGVTKKGTGFVQPQRPHEHWHIDISYVNLMGTFYYLCSVLDGASRAILHWELKESMTEKEVELVLQRAREAFPSASPRIISDNGPQFIANDFKSFIRLTGMSHWRTSPYYPQSNGKIERWHKSLKSEGIRPAAPTTYEEAVKVLRVYVDYYNTVRLHSALGYVTPQTLLDGTQQEVWDKRNARLAAARATRAQSRQDARKAPAKELEGAGKHPSHEPPPEAPLPVTRNSKGKPLAGGVNESSETKLA